MGGNEIQQKWARFLSQPHQKLWIPGRKIPPEHRMPSMNDLLRWKGSLQHPGITYTRRKKAIEEEIWGLCCEQGLIRVERAWFRFIWIEKDMRRDKDNIAAGGRKLILDGLVAARKLPGDGWRYVVGWEDEFKVDRGEDKHGVLVEIFEQEEG